VIRVRDKRQVKGRVKRVTVNHYPDGTADTEIELEDGTLIVYGNSAYAARGDDILAIGSKALMREVMTELHPKFFTLTGPKEPFEFKTGYSFIFPLDVEVIYAKEVYNETKGIAYKERPE